MKKFIIPFALFAILSLVACDNRGDVRLTLQSKIASQYPGAIILDNDKEIYKLFMAELVKKEVDKNFNQIKNDVKNLIEKEYERTTPLAQKYKEENEIED